MPTRIQELNRAFERLHCSRGQARLAHFKIYCQAVLAAQQRGEIGILPAASYIEGCLQYPELTQNPDTERILDKACTLRSPVCSYSDTDQAAWRKLVRLVEALPA